MKLEHALAVLGSLAIAAGQPASKAILTNLDSAPWKRDKESESVLLHADPASGAMELLVRFPAGHVIPPHYHESNERIIVAEGQLTLRQDSGETVVQTGGFAFLPAKEVQRITCSSTARCTFYILWDGNPKAYPAK